MPVGDVQVLLCRLPPRRHQLRRTEDTWSAKHGHSMQLILGKLRTLQFGKIAKHNTDVMIKC